MANGTGMGRFVLGLERFALAGAEFAGAEVWLHIETDPAVVGYPDCGVLAGAHARCTIWLRD